MNKNSENDCVNCRKACRQGRLYHVVVLLFSLLVLASCGSANKPPQEYPYQVYRLSSDGLSLVSSGYEPDSDSEELILKELLGQLQTSDETGTAPISGTVSYSNMVLNNGVVWVYFTSYSVEDTTRDVLIRAAIVRTLCQVDGVFGVTFLMTPGSTPFSNSVFTHIIVYQPEDFVLDIGEPSEPIMLRLYFPNSAGDGIKEVERPAILDDYKSREEYLMEMLIAGPTQSETGAFAGIPSAVKILSVSTKNHICTVNLSREFARERTDANPKLVIQSIAYTLIRNLDYVEGVSFYVDGKPLTTFRTYDIPTVVRESEENSSEEKQ